MATREWTGEPFDLASVLRALPDGVLVADSDLTILFANESAAALLGRTVGDLVGSKVSTVVPARLREAHRAGIRRYLEAGDVRRLGGPPLRVLATRADGSEIELEVTLARAAPGPAGEPRVVAALRSAGGRVELERISPAERRAAERDEADLLVRTQAAERTQSYLLGASRILARTAGYAESLDALAALAVDSLADLCLIDVVDDTGTVTRMAARHADPERQAEVEELGRSYRSPPGGTHPSITVMTTGRSVRTDSIDDDALRAWCRDEAHFALVKRLGPSSYLGVPLKSRDRILGTVLLVSTDPGRHFSDAELALAESLAGHAAEVIEKTRRFEREHEVAHVLQESLLPGAGIELSGYELAVRYLPSTVSAEVGGDWYDVVTLAGGQRAVTVGDVSGHDLGAATTMGQIRSVCRALAARTRSGAELIDALRDSWEPLGLDRIATFAVAVLDPVGERVTVSSAGHPPPLLVHGQPVEVLQVSPSTPLGAPARPSEEMTVAMPAGSTLLCYTDGLVETRHRPLTEGLERLRRWAGQGGTEPGRVCDTVLAALRTERCDDVAVLAVRRER